MRDANGLGGVLRRVVSGRAVRHGRAVDEPRSRADVRDLGRRYLLVGVLALLVVVFSILSPHAFATADNATSILASNIPLVLLALGNTFVLMVGEFDIGFAGGLGLAAAIVARMTAGGGSLAAALVVSFTVAVLVGIVIYLFVVRLGVSSFIATLGMGNVTLGVALAITGAQTLPDNSQALATAMGSGPGGLGYPVYYALVIFSMCWFLSRNTRTGRHMFFTGEGRTAAQLAGIRVDRIRGGALIASAVAAWAAAVVLFGQTGGADATMGQPYILLTYAAVFLGFTTVQTGRFNFVGTLVGVYLVAVATTGLELLSVANWVTQLFDGAILMIAVGAANLFGRPMARRWFRRAKAASDETGSSVKSATTS